MRDMNSGYSGYSMSNRACEAYGNGEKPISKWTKADILAGVRKIRPDMVDDLKRLTVSELRIKALWCSSWHHTSSYCNETDFYMIDEDFVSHVTKEDIDKIVAARKKTEKPDTVKYKGDIFYLEWGGTRKHPKATERSLRDVWIEERGSFYVVTDDSGYEVLRKKVGSNGTRVIRTV